MKRTLTLKKETLTALTTGQLESVNAGQAISKDCPTNYCYPSWDVRCQLSRIMAECI